MSWFKKIFTIGVVLCSSLANAMSDDQCMALAVFKEARGESLLGQAAVVKTILNRVEHRFASSACGVVFQRTRKVCQFSWACEKPNRYDASLFQPYLEVVRMVKSGTFDMLLSDRILFFHSRRLRNQWRYPLITVIGNHKFFGIA